MPHPVQTAPHGWEQIPTEVSLSVTDLHVDGRWIRTLPVIQVEGGSYSPDGARQLRAAPTALLAMIDDEGTGNPAVEPMPGRF